MVAKLVLVGLLVLAFVTAILVAGFRYLDRQARRRHDRRLAREEREYDVLMEEVESDRDREERSR